MINFRQTFSNISLEKLQKTLFYLFILFLPTQLGKHFWLQESIAKGMRIDYFAPTFYFVDLLVIFIIISIIFKKKPEKINFSQLLFPLSILIQIFWSQTPIGHLCFSIRILIIFTLISYAKKNINYNQEKINTIFFFQSLFLFLTSSMQIIFEKNIGGILYFLGERNFTITTPGISLFNLFGKNFLRPYSTFSHPNALSGYSLIIFFYIYYFNKNKNQALLSMFFLFLTINLTFSQNTWFFFTLFFFITNITKKNQQNIKKLILTIFLSLILPFIMLYFGKKITLSQSFEIRNTLFEHGIKNNYKNILLGGGWYSDIINLFKNNFLIKNRVVYQPIHNSWWFTTLSIGILPLIALKKHFKTTYIPKKWLLIFCLVVSTGTFDHYWITQIQNLYLLSFLFIDFQKNNF